MAKSLLVDYSQKLLSYGRNSRVWSASQPVGARHIDVRDNRKFVCAVWDGVFFVSPDGQPLFCFAWQDYFRLRPVLFVTVMGLMIRAWPPLEREELYNLNPTACSLGPHTSLSAAYFKKLVHVPVRLSI